MEYTNGSAEGTRWERPDAPLGTLIYRAGLLSKDKLESALEEGRRNGRRLGEILLQKGWIEEKDLARLLAGQKGLAFVSLRGRGFDEETARSLPERVCRFHNAMAVGYEADELLVAIANPGNDDAVSDIRSELGRPFRLVVATPTEIRTALDETFGNGRVETAAPIVAVPLTPPAPANGAADLGAGLRIAASADVPADEPEPEPLPEPTVADAAPVPAVPEEAERVPEHEPEPEPARELEPAFAVAESQVAAAVDHAAVAPAPPVLGLRDREGDPGMESRSAGDEPVREPEPARELEPAFAVAETQVAAAVDHAPVAPAPPVFGLRDREVDPGPDSRPVGEEPVRQPEPAREPDGPPGTHEIRIEQLEPPQPRREEPTGAPPEGWGPRIERNEEAHVSVAFHAPAAPGPAPSPPAPLQFAAPAVETRPEPPAPVEPVEQASPSRVADLPGSEEDQRFRIVLELEGDEELDVGAFGDTTSAEEAARDFIARLARRDEWPQIGDRFVRPERIRAIEIRERQRFTGSSRRTLWSGDEDR